MNIAISFSRWIVTAFIFSGCAVMHHTQMGEIDSNAVLNGERFEVLVSEVGYNFEEGKNIGKAIFTNQRTRQQMDDAYAIVALFQTGPRTGNVVFDPTYADRVVDAIYAKCPQGRISGLMSIRETNKYPVVSGEIVKVIGYCYKGRS